MRLSVIVQRVLTALEENYPNQVYLGGVKILLNGLMQQYGDVELNIEVRRVPHEEVVDVEAKEKHEGRGTGPGEDGQ